MTKLLHLIDTSMIWFKSRPFQLPNIPIVVSNIMHAPPSMRFVTMMCLTAY